MLKLSRFARVLAAALALAAPARADKVTVRGITLEGTVLSVTSANVSMKTIYGDGTLTFKIADVTRIETAGRLRVYHGEELTEAQTLEIAGDTLRADGAAIPIASLHAVQNTAPGEDVGLLDRIALQYPF
jgi:hypothetical protein